MTTRLLHRMPWMFAAAALLATGCGGPSANRATAEPSCVILHPASAPADTLTVVVFDRINPANAPWGRNREERFVFSHLYETLVNIDCHGKIQPGLAKSWLRASDGWLIELREDAHFWDGMPVTSRDVVACFEPSIQTGVAIDQVDVIDERRLLIHTGHADAIIKLLAQPFLAISKAAQTPGMPVGTGRWRIDEDRPVEEALVMFPVIQETPAVRFVRANVSDARDIMDGTADAMITDDPVAIEYSRTRSSASRIPLAFDRAYYLLAPARGLQVERHQPTINLPDGLLDDLARNATRKDARGGPTLVAQGGAACPFDGSGLSLVMPLTDKNLLPQVFFDASDRVAAGLAERIVAVAAMDTTTSADARALVEAVPGLGPGVRAVGKRASDRDDYLMGISVAKIVSLSWCADFPRTGYWFMLNAKWLYPLGDAGLARAVLPLIETRPHFITTSDRIGFVDDGAGNVRIAIPPPGARR